MRRVLLEASALVLLALGAAAVSNALAGPDRHLSWRPREVRTPVRPVEAKPVEAKPVEAKPAEANPVEAKSAEGKPTEAKPAGGKPEKARPDPAPKPPEARPAPAQKAPPAAPPDPAAELRARFPALTDAAMAEVGAEDAHWLHGRGALFLDARRRSEWVQGRIAGARSLPVWEDGLADKVEQAALLAPDLRLPVVVYCGGGDCRDSHLLAEKLFRAGFRNLRIYTGGFPEWQARGWPAARGEQP